MKSFLIDPENQTITPCEFDPEILQPVYDLIGCDLVECVYLNDASDALYVDEEGLMHGGPMHFFRIQTPHGEQDICGKAVLVGTDMRTGCTVEARMTQEQLTSSVRFIRGMP